MVYFCYMNEAQLRQWVEANPGRVNYRDEGGCTPLFTAVSDKQSVPLVLWLLDEKGADVNGSTSGGWTALHVPQSLAILDALLDHGADPTRSTSTEHRTPLMHQASRGNVDLVARLLEDPRVRATINVRALYGDTALCYCDSSSTESSRLLIAQLLLKAGANSTTTTGGSKTPLEYVRILHRTDSHTIVLLEQAPNAEKTWLIVKTRRLVMTATTHNALPSYLGRRAVQGLPLPRLAMVPLTTGPNDDDDEEGRALCTMLTFVFGMGGGPEDAGIPRDIFRVVMDLLMPKWDPLRLGAVGTGAPL